MFTQTALGACVFVLKRFSCQMQCFDWLTRLRGLGCQIEVNAYGSIVEHDEDDEGHVRTETSEHEVRFSRIRGPI